MTGIDTQDFQRVLFSCRTTVMHHHSKGVTTSRMSRITQQHGFEPWAWEGASYLTGKAQATDNQFFHCTNKYNKEPSITT